MAKNIYQQRRDMVGQSAPGGSYFTRPGANNSGRFGNAAFGTPSTQINQDAMFSGGASAGAPMTKPAWSSPGSIGGMIGNVTPGFTGDNNNIPSNSPSGQVLQRPPGGQFERVSAGLYRGSDGQLVRSNQNPAKMMPPKTLRRQPGTVPSGMMGGTTVGGGAGVGGGLSVPGVQPQGQPTGSAVGSGMAKPSGPVPFAGTRSEGFLSADGRINGSASGSATGAMPGNGQGYGAAAGSAVGRPMPTAGSAQVMNGPGPQTGGPLVSALGGIDQPQAQDPQAAFRKYQIQRGQMQQQAGGPQNYSLTRMMPDGSMVY